PDLQLPAEPRQRPPHQAHLEQARSDHRGRHRRARHRAPHAPPSGPPQRSERWRLRAHRPLRRRRRRGRMTQKLSEKHIEALAIAMIVAPGVYARNRMFDLLSSPSARRARMRASTVRGLVPQLGRATGVTVSTEPRGTETVCVLRYRIVAMGLTRVVDL